MRCADDALCLIERCILTAVQRRFVGRIRSATKCPSKTVTLLKMPCTIRDSGCTR